MRCVFAGKLSQCLHGDTVHNPTPTGVNDGECPGGRHDDDRRAIGVAKQRSDVIAGDVDGIGALRHTLLSCDDIAGRLRANGFDMGAVHLIGHEKRHIPRTERFGEQRAIGHDVIKRVAHMGAEIERVVESGAYPAGPAGERDAHAASVEKDIVGERA